MTYKYSGIMPVPLYWFFRLAHTKNSKKQDKPPAGGGLMLSMVAASVDKCYHGRLTKIS